MTSDAVSAERRLRPSTPPFQPAADVLLGETADVYFARDGLWVDVRLAKNDFDDKDQATFDEVLKSARIEEHK